MRIIISPAKKMQVRTDISDAGGLPFFLEDAEILMNRLKSFSRQELKQLYQANDSITDLNYRRFQDMELEQNLTPAVLSYVGLQYQSMAPEVFTVSQWAYIKEHLYILSGFYGCLNALDGVVPYRLEMQAALKGMGKNNLYDFWGDRIYEKLAQKENTILNLASKEYSRAVEPYVKPDCRYITCDFCQESEGRIKVKATAAKMARGDMVRFLAEKQIKDPEQVKEYDGLNYQYQPTLSTDSRFVFLTLSRKNT